MNQPSHDPLNEQWAAEDLAEFEQRRATQQRRFYARRPKHIGNVVAQLVQRKGYAQVRAAGKREQAWRTALAEQGDEAWLATTQVAGLCRGVLEVQVANSLLMQELMFRKETLLEQLQGALPDEGIKQIKFSVGQVS